MRPTALIEYEDRRNGTHGSRTVPILEGAGREVDWDAALQAFSLPTSATVEDDGTGTVFNITRYEDGDRLGVFIVRKIYDAPLHSVITDEPHNGREVELIFPDGTTRSARCRHGRWFELREIYDGRSDAYLLVWWHVESHGYWGAEVQWREVSRS